MSNNFKQRQEKENKKFREWENPVTKDRYIRMPHEAINHEAFASLSVYAKVLYMYMKDWAYGSKEFVEKHKNGGYGEFEFSVRFAKSVLNCSIQKALNTIKELIDKGFIERMNNSTYSKGVSRFRFSNRWHKGDMV